MPRFKIRTYTSSIGFNGSSSALVKTSPVGINTGTNNVTVAAWIYLISDALGTVCALDTGLFNTRAMSAGQQGSVYYMFSDGVIVNKSITKAAFQASISTNRWRRIIYSTNGTNIDIFVDGALLTAQTMSISTNALANLFFGKRVLTGVPSQVFNGYMKDIQVYNQYFTLADAQDDFFNAKVQYTPVSSFAMEEGSGTSVADSVGSNSLIGTAISWTTNYIPYKDRYASSGKVATTDRVTTSGRSFIT